MATQLNEKLVRYGQLMHFKEKQDVYNAGIYAKKEDLTTVYRYKGNVESYTDLPTADQIVGDTYNITNANAANNIKAGDNVTWNGTGWDNLSGIFDINEAVKVSPEIFTAGVKIADITVNGNTIEVKAPAVTATAVDTAGYKAATVSIDGAATDIYIPVCDDSDIDKMFSGT